VGAWWRKQWHFEIIGGAVVPNRLPPPIGEIGGGILIATAMQVSERRLLVETFTASEALADVEMTYVSIVAAWMATKFPPESIRVEGVVNHPLLSVSRLNAELLAMLEAHGY
jgi:hypothetical protein